MAHVALQASSLPALSLPAARHAARRALDEEPLLARAALLHLALAPIFGVAMALDPRTIHGFDPWVKPLKFALSIAVYMATVALLLLPLREGAGRRLVRSTTLAPLALEMGIIALQSARGVPSHFNNATPLDSALFGIMGLAILVATLGGAILLALHARSRVLPRALAWSVRAGLAVSLVGSAVGGAMVANESHAVDAPEDARRVPFLGWLREGGDLRIAHFIGLHALQALPLVGLATLGHRRAGAAVGLATAGYAALVVVLYASAAAGRGLLG